MLNRIFYIIAALILFTSTANAQIFQGQKPEKNVPNIVQTSFDTKFHSKDVVWFTHYQGRYDNQLVYEGKFIFDNRYSTAVYNREGELIAFVATVEYNEIPLKARQYMKDNYAGRDPVEAVIVTRGKDDVTYEIGVVIDNEYVVKIFSKDGEFIKSTRA